MATNERALSGATDKARWMHSETSRTQANHTTNFLPFPISRRSNLKALSTPMREWRMMHCQHGDDRSSLPRVLEMRCNA